MTTRNCRDCRYHEIQLNNETYCNHHDKNINLTDTACDSFQLNKFILIEEGDILIKNTDTGMYYDGAVAVQKLNYLAGELSKCHRIFLKRGEDNQLQLQSILAKYAARFNRESSEFNLICRIAVDLGVTPSLFGAKNDEE